jgi:hypothetical protein
MCIQLYLAIIIGILYIQVVISLNTVYISNDESVGDPDPNVSMTKSYNIRGLIKGMIYTVLYILCIYYLCIHGYNIFAWILISIPIFIFSMIILALKNMT